MGLLALALVSSAGRSASAQVIDCTKGSPGPNMTIKIFNSTPDFDIYPLLFAGSASQFDQWMEACFRVPARDIDVNNNTLYPRASQYRMYINCCGPSEHGIPPGGSVTITLPFYSPLVQGDIVPKPPSNGIEQFIDWWNGGGINVYAAPKGSPYPDAVAHHWADDFTNNRARTITRNAPSCSGANGVPAACALHVFASPASIQNWEPQQLIEYTLAAAGLDGTRGNDPDKPLYIWDPKNVDYDVSFVNYAYLPAAIVPFASPLSGTCCEIGWIGSTATIQATFKAIDDWHAGTFLGSNWPSYIDQFAPKTSPPTVVAHRVPSALEIFANRGSLNDNSNFYPAPYSSPPIIRMKQLWELCDNPAGDPILICQKIRPATALIRANYNNYLSAYNDYLLDPKDPTKTWNKWACKLPAVTPLTEDLLLQQLYGWTPFAGISNCDAKANQLADTPGYGPAVYQTTKIWFDEAQYWFYFNTPPGSSNYGQWTNSSQQDYAQFDPYVPLIHGRDFMNSPYTYAYSVDDAFGNMQADGTGLIIAVGGSTGLPLPDNHVTSEVTFSLGGKSSYAPPVGDITFATYDRCKNPSDPQTPVNPNGPAITGGAFAVPAGVDNTPNSVVNCQIAAKDTKGRLYTFRLKGLPKDFPRPVPGQDGWPDPAQRTAINQAFVDCSGVTNPDVLMGWCQQIAPFQDTDPGNPHLSKYFVPTGGPPSCDRDSAACNPK